MGSGDSVAGILIRQIFAPLSPELPAGTAPPLQLLDEAGSMMPKFFASIENRRDDRRGSEGHDHEPARSSLRGACRHRRSIHTRDSPGQSDKNRRPPAD